MTEEFEQLEDAVLDAGLHHEITWAEAKQQIEALERGRMNARVDELLDPIRNTQAPDAVPDDWQPIDLGRYVRGEVPDTRPEEVAGLPLLYPGLSHWISGPPECLKSWLAQLAVAERLTDGRRACYVDFESDAGPIVARMLALGVRPELIEKNLIYIRPSSAITCSIADVVAGEIAISVLDGINAGMGMAGKDPLRSKDFTEWWTMLGRPLQQATSGPTLAIDHVVKREEERGNYAYGSVSKLAVVDGAHIGVELVSHFGRGLTGKARLRVHKDRPGWLRTKAPRGTLAVLSLTSDLDSGAITWTLEASPDAVGRGPDEWRPTELMERISKFLEEWGRQAPWRQVAAAVKGRGDDWKRKALDFLVLDGYVEVNPGARNATLYRSLKPYPGLPRPTQSSPDAVDPVSSPTQQSLSTASDALPTRSGRSDPTASDCVPRIEGDAVVRNASSDGLFHPWPEGKVGGSRKEVAGH